MIVAVCVSLNEILEQEKDFLWPRPDHCPKCGGGRLWFHGFVLALFDGLMMGVWLRRSDRNPRFESAVKNLVDRLIVPVALFIVIDIFSLVSILWRNLA